MRGGVFLPPIQKEPKMSYRRLNPRMAYGKLIAVCLVIACATTAVFAVSSPLTAGTGSYIPRHGLIFTYPEEDFVLAPGASININAGSQVDHAQYTKDNPPTGVTPAFTCAEDSARRGSGIASVAETQSGSCIFTVTANTGASGVSLVYITFTSNVRDPDNDFYTLTQAFHVNITDEIIFTAPQNLSVRAGGTIQVDASAYASHAHVMVGSPPAAATLTCGEPTSRAILAEPPFDQTLGPYVPAPRRLHSRLDSVTRADAANSPCVYTVVAERFLVLTDSDGNTYNTGIEDTGPASFVVPYTSTATTTVNGNTVAVTFNADITLQVTPTTAVTAATYEEGFSPYPMIPLLDAGKCSTVYGAIGGLLRDCQALVAAQNHWASVDANRNLGVDHPLRSWGTGIYKNINRWPGVIISGVHQTSDNDLAVGAGGVVTDLDLSGQGIYGALPDSLSQLSGLRTLKLHNNYLGGNIPVSYGRLAIDPSGNPPSHGANPEWGSLRDFYFCGNYLDGAIPQTLLTQVINRQLRLAGTASADRILAIYYSTLHPAPEWAESRAEVRRIDVTCQTPGNGIPPLPQIRAQGAAYARVGAGGQVVTRLIKGLDLSWTDTAGYPCVIKPDGPDSSREIPCSQGTYAAPLYVWNAATAKWKQATEYHCISNSDPCTRWRQTVLPAGALFYYVDGYIDCRTLVNLNLESSRTGMAGGSAADCNDLRPFYGLVARSIVPPSTVPPSTSPASEQPPAQTQEPTQVADTNTGISSDPDTSSDTGTSSDAGTSSGTDAQSESQTSVWNTFTVSARVSVADIREQLDLDASQRVYVWNAERQAWSVATGSLSEGDLVTFETPEKVDEDDLGDLNLDTGTTSTTLTPGWTLLNSPETISRGRSSTRNFFLSSGLIDCDSSSYVLAVTSYSSENDRWSLWLPCHPLDESRLTYPGSAYRRISSIGQGDLVYIYYRGTRSQTITWNSEILKFEPSG